MPEFSLLPRLDSTTPHGRRFAGFHSLRAISVTQKPSHPRPSTPVPPGRRSRLSYICGVVGAIAAVALTWSLVAQSRMAPAPAVKIVSGTPQKKVTESGKTQRWQLSEVTISIDESVDACDSEALASIRRAFDSWTTSANVPRVRLERTRGATLHLTPDGVNSVLAAPITLPGHEQDLAVTIGFADPSTGEIVEADIVLNTSYDLHVLTNPTSVDQPTSEFPRDDSHRWGDDHDRADDDAQLWGDDHNRGDDDAQLWGDDHNRGDDDTQLWGDDRNQGDDGSPWDGDGAAQAWEENEGEGRGTADEIDRWQCDDDSQGAADGAASNALRDSGRSAPPDDAGSSSSRNQQTNGATPSCSGVSFGRCNESYDLESIMAHEAGHFFGLGEDVDDAYATMFYCTSTCETHKRSLAASDTNTMAEVYAAGYENPPEVSCSVVSGRERTGSPLALLGLVGLALLARRRRGEQNSVRTPR